MAVELRDRLQFRLGLRFSTTFTFNYPTISDLAEFIAGELVPSHAEEPGADPEQDGEEPGDIDAASGEDLDRMLDEEMEYLDDLFD